MLLAAKYLVTAAIIVVVSEIARRSDRLGALIAALPIITLMILIWLKVENQEVEKIANHAYFTFWYVLPTLPMFLLIPYLLKQGMNFWLTLGLGCALTLACFVVMVWVLKRMGIELLP